MVHDAGGEGEWEGWPPVWVAERDAAEADEGYTKRLADTLRTHKERVKYILSRYPSSRNSDTYISWLYLRLFHGIKLPWLTWEQLMAINFESIRRARQLIQAEGLYPPTDQVAAKRRRKQAAMRRLLAQGNSNAV